MARHMVNYGDREIYFKLERKDVKNVNLNIRPDMTIQVSASDRVPLDFIKDFVREKGSWIVKKIDYFKKFQPETRPEREYVSGESFSYLGRQYRLRVRKAQVEGVKYFRGFIYIYVRDREDIRKKEKLLDKWFYEKSNIHFSQSLDRMYKLVRQYNIPKPQVKIRNMKSRWGSCHSQEKTIILNSQLIKAGKDCIDYVVLHELIHFKHKNHDNNFYTLLSSLMPDWEKRKKILDEKVIMN